MRILAGVLMAAVLLTAGCDQAVRVGGPGKAVASVVAARGAVRVGADPALMPLDETVVTQIIPLRHVPAEELVRDLKALLSAEGQIESVPGGAGMNALVITDTSARIHRLAKVVVKLDVAVRPVTWLHADYDARTNTVIVFGPAAQVKQAVNMLDKIESIPVDYLERLAPDSRPAPDPSLVEILNRIFGSGGNTMEKRGGLTTSGRAGSLTGGSLTGGSLTGGSLTGGTTGRSGRAGGTNNGTPREDVIFPPWKLLDWER